jgi:predicted secreted protein
LSFYFGIRSEVEAGDMTPGTDPGAPIAPKLLAKFALTTLISAAVFAAVAALAKYAG